MIQELTDRLNHWLEVAKYLYASDSEMSLGVMYKDFENHPEVKATRKLLRETNHLSSEEKDIPENGLKQSLHNKFGKTIK